MELSRGVKVGGILGEWEDLEGFGGRYIQANHS
jgi:hypothetical protein